MLRWALALYFLGVTLLLFNLLKVNSLHDITANEVAPLAAILGAVVPLFIFYKDKRSFESEWIANQAEFFLEKAYETLAEGMRNGIPENSRSKWILTARFLLTAQSLKSHITNPTHLSVVQGKEHYWRQKFFLLLKVENGTFTEDYFSENRRNTLAWRPKEKAPLSLESVTAVYRFVQWPEESADFLDEVRPFSNEELENMIGGTWENLARFLSKVQSDSPDTD